MCCSSIPVSRDMMRLSWLARHIRRSLNIRLLRIFSHPSPPFELPKHQNTKPPNPDFNRILRLLTFEQSISSPFYLRSLPSHSNRRAPNPRIGKRVYESTKFTIPPTRK